MTHSCMNCGSDEIYVKKVRVWGILHRALFNTAWRFDMRVCGRCGLTNWFLPQKDLAWVKRNFTPIAASQETGSSAGS
jgi:hypothetical protein